jgi:hypothetical protein
MKEYIENGFKIKEYSYEDWWEGRAEIRGGKHLINDLDTKEKYYNFLPLDVWDRILSKKRELFEGEVNRNLEWNQKSFLDTLKKSENKERLLQIETEKYDQLFHNEKLPLGNSFFGIRPIEGFNFSDSEIASIRKIYIERIVRGKKDYSLTKSPNMQINIGIGDYHHVRVESMFKYFKWLKEYKIESPITSIIDNQVKKEFANIGYKLKSEYLKNAAVVYDDLIKGELISPTVTLSQFKRIINGGKVVEKVTWIGSISSLRHFSFELARLSNTREKYKVAINCFQKENIELTIEMFHNNRSESKTDINTINKAINRFTETDITTTK